MFDFTDQVVIVTGASGNLGGAVAEAFLAARARLALPDRSADRLPKLFPNLVGSDRHYLATGIDVTDPADAKVLVQETVRRLSRIDVLAQIFLFLASEAASPIHGALIPAYGLS